MTKKDYERIAAAIKPIVEYLQFAQRTDFPYEQVQKVVNNISLEMKQDNPRFDRTRFYAACGL